MMNTTHYYELLGLKPGASEEEIKQAYRDLSKVWHPDRFFKVPYLQKKAQDKLKEIDAAYEKIMSFIAGSHEEFFQSDHEQFSEPQDKKYDGSQPPPDSPLRSLNESPSSNGSLNQKPRPWIRFWARTLDLILLGFPTALLFGLFFPEFAAKIIEGGPFIVELFLLPVIVVIEAVILAAFGNTPAKAILNTKITNAEGKNLSFAEALKRSFYIYVVGYALGIPLIFLFTYLWQYKKLKKQGKTSWDNKFNFNVSHSHIGGVRIASYVTLYLVCLLIIVGINSEQKMNIKKSEQYSSIEDPQGAYPNVEYRPIDYELLAEFMRKKDWQGLLNLSQQLVLVHPDDVHVWNYLGLAYENLQQYSYAIQAYNKALHIDPRNSVFYFNRAYAYWGNKQSEAAIEDFSKAIALDPAFSDAYHSRGDLYYKKSEFDKAVSDYEKACKMKVESACKKLKDIEEHIKYIERNEKEQQGRAYYENGQYDKAIEEFSKLIAIERDVGLYDYRGLSYYKSGQYDKAIEDFSKVVELSPSYKTAYYNRGLSYYKSGQYEKAIQDFSMVVGLDPFDEIAYFNRGVSYYKLEQYDMAMKDFKKACNLGVEDGCKNMEILKKKYGF